MSRRPAAAAAAARRTQREPPEEAHNGHKTSTDAAAAAAISPITRRAPQEPEGVRHTDIVMTLGFPTRQQPSVLPSFTRQDSEIKKMSPPRKGGGGSTLVCRSTCCKGRRGRCSFVVLRLFVFTLLACLGLWNLELPEEVVRQAQAMWAKNLGNTYKYPSTVFLQYDPVFDDKSGILKAHRRRHKLSPLHQLLQPDFGGLEIGRLLQQHKKKKKNGPQEAGGDEEEEDEENSSSRFQRSIPDNEYEQAETYKKKIMRAADKVRVSSKYTFFDDLDFDTLDCVRPAWSYRAKPNCNNFHEQPLLADDSSTTKTTSFEYIDHGHYRDSWYVFEDYSDDHKLPSAVLKHLRYQHEPDLRSQHKMLTEALVMEVLTGSPVITHIHGYCSTSHLVEPAKQLTMDIVPYNTRWQDEHGRISDREMAKLEQKYGAPYSFNNFTVTEKLDIAIQMAEGLAEMHGYPGGVIVNDDAHPDQWLRSYSGHVILNDMNNAQFLAWNSNKKKYCKYWISYGGDYRAPEEYDEDGAYVDETVDLWPMGNLIHSLLTGLWPYYNLTSSKEIQKVTLTGARPYLHPSFRNRTFIEQRMTKLMDRCHVLKPSNRVDIFEAVKFLKQTKKIHDARERNPGTV